MLVLKSDILKPTGLAFSPDGQSLVAAGPNCLQVWPRWPDKPPEPLFNTHVNLERFAFSSDGAELFQYLSADSRTRVLDVTTMYDDEFDLPTDPAWFHFTTEGGFFIVSIGDGELGRYDYTPHKKKHLRTVWTIDRAGERREGQPRILGSHYRFGDVCGAAGVFVAMEYRRLTDDQPFDEIEDFDGETVNDSLTVRSVADGSLVYREEITEGGGLHLLLHASPRLTIHPSGKYFAYPEKKVVRFRSLSSDPAPRSLRFSARATCRAVAFHPGGQWLAAIGDDSKVKLHDTTTWKLARTFAWEIGELRAIAFSADGTHAAVIGAGTRRSGGKIVVWDVDT